LEKRLGRPGQAPHRGGERLVEAKTKPFTKKKEKKKKKNPTKLNAGIKKKDLLSLPRAKKAMAAFLSSPSKALQPKERGKKKKEGGTGRWLLLWGGGGKGKKLKKAEGGGGKKRFWFECIEGKFSFPLPGGRGKRRREGVRALHSASEKKESGGVTSHSTPSCEI